MQHLFVSLTLSVYNCVFLQTRSWLANVSVRKRSGNRPACRWLTDELVLHSLQQCLVGIFRLHGSRAFPCQHGANQMLSTAWQKTHRHSSTCTVNMYKLISLLQECVPSIRIAQGPQWVHLERAAAHVVHLRPRVQGTLKKIWPLKH